MYFPICKSRSLQNMCVVETGISGFNNLTVFVMKITFRKLPSNVLNYPDYKKNFDTKFMNSVYSALSREKNEILQKDLGVLFNVCLKVLNRHAPQKKKYIRGNSKPFMIKEFSKIFM